MKNLIKILNDHSDSIWGKNFEALKPKQEVKRVHFSELGNYLGKDNYAEND